MKRVEKKEKSSEEDEKPKDIKRFGLKTRGTGTKARQFKGPPKWPISVDHPIRDNQKKQVLVSN